MTSSRMPAQNLQSVLAPFGPAHAVTSGPKALLVAPLEHRNLHYNALRSASRVQFCFAANYRDLWLIAGMEQLRIAVLCDALPSFELEAACRLIRRRSRRARILILRSRPSLLDDSLYDDRIAANVAPELLRATVQRLLGKRS